VLLRHGRTAWNAQRRFQGQLDPPLDEVGRMQAYEVAGLIAALRPHALVSSDSLRAWETAEIVGAAAGVTPSKEPRLRERSLGHWEGLTREEVAATYPDEYADWIAGRDVTSRGGESRDDVALRALAAFEDHPDVETLVFVTHSATAMALCNALLGIAQRLHPLGPLANCHWSELWADDDDAAQRHGGGGSPWRLRGHNLGVPGTVLPVPSPVGLGAEDAPDAEA
jgi:probable phosphoglycerate mutase